MSTHIGEPQDSYIEEIPQDERRFTGWAGWSWELVCSDFWLGQRSRPWIKGGITGIGNRFRQPQNGAGSGQRHHQKYRGERGRQGESR